MKREAPTYGNFPVLPVRNTVAFPGVTTAMVVGRPKSVEALTQAQASDGWLLVVTQKDPQLNTDPNATDLYNVGTLAHIDHIKGSAKDGFQVLIRGSRRMAISSFFEKDRALNATAEELADVWDLDSGAQAAMLKGLKDLAHDIMKLIPADTSQIETLIDDLTDLSFLSYLALSNMEIPLSEKQELLEQASIKDRTLTLLQKMQNFKQGLQVQNEVRDRVSRKITESQRESILREHMNAIREELGDEDDIVEEYRRKIQKAKMPKKVETVAKKELKRLGTINASSPESAVIRNYLDLLCEMPWKKSTASTIDLDKVRSTLNEDHHGMEKVKKRILQHLAVMKLKKQDQGTILLLVGPPGVGKTSLGKSIASALGREFVRASLGGVRDDSEIRGHRRTYIGAMPGRIIEGIRRAKTNNPVFLLDEIDKLSHSYHGDPASALLEVLDPEQNKEFQDHYLDVPWDLSRVMFIATANSMDSIPGPLRDRLEIISLTGYTPEEKFHIAKEHLLPSQLKEHGLGAEEVHVDDVALNKIITHHTREAGVRELKRRIAAVCRGVTERILKEKKAVHVHLEDLEELLGPERYSQELVNQVAPPGVVTGLAWTPFGGEILFIEAGSMPGHGKLTLTGQLGDVMKESAQIALSLVRSRLIHFSPKTDFDKNDIHIHVPSGAIPKDGPSAGIAMVTAVASLLSGRSVNPKLAMTGEITLRGMVMPVGGVKEKVIAAYRSGVEKVILPKRNEKDLKDIPEEVRSGLQFVFVSHVSDVLRAALGLEWPDESLGSHWKTDIPAEGVSSEALE